MINDALQRGSRGLPGDSTLARLLDEHRPRAEPSSDPGEDPGLGRGAPRRDRRVAERKIGRGRRRTR